MKTGDVFTECSGLDKLSEKLGKIKELAETDPMKAIVLFFQNLAPWHNNGGVKEMIDCLKRENTLNRFSRLIEKLRLFQEHLDQTNSFTGNINRTPRGLDVSEKTVFLGGFTPEIASHSIDSWKEIKGKSKNGVSVFRAISEQARKFMQIHLDRMVSLISEIETETKKINGKKQKITKKEEMNIHLSMA
jgi:hypothetical protein